MFESIRSAAREYRQRGFAVCRIEPGEKQPKYRKWNQRSLEPEDFAESDNIGIISGKLSRNLMCVDLDSADAVALADDFLPPTGMVDGRQGKPRSHRWFLTRNVPPQWEAPRSCAGGMGGPSTVQFARGREKGDMVVELRGTGSQAVVPCSIWTSEDRQRRERREWFAFEEPAEMDYLELLERVAALAAKCGGKSSRWERYVRAAHPQERRPGKILLPSQPPDLLPLPTGEAALRALAYLSTMEPAIAGQAGDRRTFRVACVLVRDFGLAVDEALPLLLKWNLCCIPPWTQQELLHKLNQADAFTGQRGAMLRPRKRKIEVRIRDGDSTILVGVDCNMPDQSFVSLEPDLWAGVVKRGKTFTLAPELDAIDWVGKEVVLATPSNVMTNKKTVYDEHRLACLLIERGAEVRALRIYSPDGRRLTFKDAEEVEETTPPLTHSQADLDALEASKRAKEQEAARRALPRAKGSPKLQKALAWLRRQKAMHITQDVVRQASKKGISERTLSRAMKEIFQEKNSA